MKGTATVRSRRTAGRLGLQGLIAHGCRALVAATMAALALAGSAHAEPWRPVAQSCVSASGSGGACAVGRAAGGLWKAVVAPGGGQAYGIAYDAQSLLIFDRNPATGLLIQRGA